jgi:prefoldin subunit 5
MASKKPIKPRKAGRQSQISEDFLTLLLDEVQAARAELAALRSLVEKKIMPSVQDLTDKLTALQTAVDAAEQRADDRDAALTQKLADLQAAFDALQASGASIPQATIDSVQASIDDLNAFAAAAPETIVPPAP